MQLVDAILPQDTPPFKTLPWKLWVQKMQAAGIIAYNWPHDVLFPPPPDSKTQSDKGIQSISSAERKFLCAALKDPDYRLFFERYEGDLRGMI